MPWPNFETNDLELESEKILNEIYYPDVERDKLVVSVIDNGIGIKLEEQQKLFKLFGCLQSSKNKNSQGIGLGLYIVKSFIEKFDG